MISQCKRCPGSLPGLVPLLLVLSLCIPAAAHGGSVTPTNSWVNFYSTASTYLGMPLPVGAQIAVFDPQGVQCAEQIVTIPGYVAPVMPCYGDDPTTPQDEGAVVGDVLHFTVNGQAAQTEAIAVNSVPVAPGTIVVWSPVQGLWQVNLHVISGGTHTPTPTPTTTSAVTGTGTPTPTASATWTATPTPTTTQTATPTAALTPTATRTPSPTPTATRTPSASSTPTPTPSASLAPSVTVTASASATPTASATASPTRTASPTPSSTPTAPIASPTATPTPTHSAMRCYLPILLK